MNLDAWDGYPIARARLKQSILENANDVLILSGDSHNAWAFELAADNGNNPWAVEFATSSVTSPGLERFLPVSPEFAHKQILASSPQLKFLDSSDRGFMLIKLTPEDAHSYWYFVDRIDNRDYEVSCRKALKVTNTDGAGTGALRSAEFPIE